MAAGRYDDADIRYDLALAAVRGAEDEELKGTLLQHQGSLAYNRSQRDRAGRLFLQALQNFQKAGDLDQAEQIALRGLAIDEELRIVRELPSDYQTLFLIAEARGDATAAAEWARKREELLEELERRAGGGSASLAPAMLRGLQALTIACAQAGAGEGILGPGQEESLAGLEQAPAPNPAFAGFLRDIAAGRPTSIPEGLPQELREWLDEAFSRG
ncbi:MAG TPA: hypothetical protein VN851_23935 [Thermoanaerobaculia bacterium]|nr:hypothetical protein [Thermoanaerobaculia bacterium]